MSGGGTLPTTHSQRTVGIDRRVVLWIDDEVMADDPLVRLLRFEGLQVSCAGTAAAGLAMAYRSPCHCILLDLNLPDAPGLAVLARLRASGVTTPVMVLTGFGDFESARAAGQLGAALFKAKPILIEELALAVRGLLDSSQERAELSLDGLTELTRQNSSCLASLLEDLHRLQRPWTEQDDSVLSVAGDWNSDSRGILIAALVRALTNSAVDVPVFLACAGALRHTLLSDPIEPPAQLSVFAGDRILEVLAKPRPSDSRVTSAIALMEADVAKHHRPKEEEIAKALNIDRAHLGRLIHAQTGFTFRHWRKGLFLKAGLMHLVSSDEHIGQIACRLLGYGHETQFDREFHEVFGLAPREFRRVWRACRSW
jgi:DNA-binding response OmpR family regulator/AraC-like DNA-binding protein